MQHPHKKQPRSPLNVAAWASLAVAACGFILLFILNNTHWTPIYFPSLPWKQNPVSFAYEARLSLILGFAFLGGALATSFIWYLWYKEQKQKAALTRKSIEQIENELLKTERLIASSKSSNEVNSGNNPAPEN